MKSKVVIRKITSLVDTIQEGITAIGYKPCHDEIIIKPNVLKGLKSGSGHLTDVRVVRALISVLNDNFSPHKIYVAESSYTNADTTEAFALAGYVKLEREFSNVKLIDLKKEKYVKREFKLEFPEFLDGKCLIDVPVLKGHPQVGLTCAIKNLKGLLRDEDKRKAHLTGLNESIASLAKEFQPCLVVVDATHCRGSHGGLYNKRFTFGRLIFGTDPLAVDHACCQLVGLKVAEVKYLDTLIKESENFAYEIDGSLAQLAQWRPFKDYIWVGRMRIYIGFACSGCWDAAIGCFNQGFLSKSPTQRMMGKVKGGLDCFARPGRVNLVVGPTHPTIEVNKLKGKTILIGDCAKRKYGSTGYPAVKGCPPDPREIRKVVQR